MRVLGRQARSVQAPSEYHVPGKVEYIDNDGKKQVVRVDADAVFSRQS